MKIQKRLLAPVLTMAMAFTALVPVTANASGSATPSPYLTTPANDGSVIGNINLSFSLPVDALAGSVQLMIFGGAPNYVRAFTLKQELAGSYNLSFNPLDMKRLMLMNYPSYFSDISTTRDGSLLGDTEYLPSGIYSISVSYRDQALGSPSSAQVDRVLITGPCAPGTYSTNGGVPVDGACNPAPIGSYVSTVGATSATLCPQGEITNGIGSTSASACHQSATPSPSLSEPLRGTSAVGTLRVYYTQPDQALTGSAKIILSNSEYSRVISLASITSGSHSITFNPLASNSELLSDHNDVFTSVSTTQNSSVITGSLPVGYYTVRFEYQDVFSNPASGANAQEILLTQQCDPGSFSISGAKDANGNCTDTSIGHYADTPGSTHETPCPKGKYSSTPGSWRCVDAAPNTYVATEGASASTPCPATYTSPQGSDALADCKKPAVKVNYCSIKKGKQATVTCIAAAASKKIPSKAKTTISINKLDKNRCVVKRGKVLGKSKGTCRVVLKVKPKKGKSATYSSRIRIS